MYDVNFPYGGDIQTSQTGDLAVVAGVDLTNQQIIRLTFTSAGGYLQHPDYGVGAPSRIGRNMDQNQLDNIEAAIMSGIQQIPTVAKTPVPTISLQLIPSTGDVFCTVTYYNTLSAQNVVISFNLDQ